MPGNKTITSQVEVSDQELDALLGTPGAEDVVVPNEEATDLNDTEQGMFAKPGVDLDYLDENPAANEQAATEAPEGETEDEKIARLAKKQKLKNQLLQKS